MLIPGFVAAARNASAAPLALGLNIVNFTRSREIRKIPAGCRLIEVKAWGAGGASVPYGTFGSIVGGAGGYISRVFEVTPGDLIAIEVGGGGELGLLTGDVRGGYGGWPDGGDGGRGRHTGSTIASISGGGGGSTRLWLQGQLALVAAGGGGAGNLNTFAGRGGGAVGGSSAHATGGAQSEGGEGLPLNANPLSRGGYLHGGQGYMTSIRALENGGGGGGGGYYGGGGGYRNDTLYSGPAGGGSSWRLDGYHLYYDLPQFAGGGISRTPVNITDTDYPGSELGYGGLYATAGRAGVMVIRAHADDPQPVRLTHHVLEALTVRTAQPTRVTQETVEVLVARAAQAVQTTQQTIEIIRTP
ncbi:putative lectin-like domain protein [Brevundimonas phage vB_BpoS-Marchewka]|uniref:receptor protein-tyrosine kinase n=1 Tax=Brevundimonas phage vB_BpoS-Marchewka TaxID=2948604 RepID=A0A9E7N3D5_9CAUD|nr:putative lectin-like domain protein [Brevundimonas phage vB_BpoS-Marchewka]